MYTAHFFKGVKLDTKYGSQLEYRKSNSFVRHPAKKRK